MDCTWRVEPTVLKLGVHRVEAPKEISQEEKVLT